MMNSIEEQILETWRAHNRIMLCVVESIPDTAMHVTLSKRGGRGIAGQLGHIHTARVWRLEATSRKFSKGLVKFTQSKVPTKRELIKAFRSSGEAVENHLRERIALAGEIRGFKRNAVPTLASIIAHESHHRGSIILTMKESGISIPEVLKWGVWDWNRFSDERYTRS